MPLSVDQKAQIAKLAIKAFGYDSINKMFESRFGGTIQEIVGGGSLSYRKSLQNVLEELDADNLTIIFIDGFFELIRRHHKNNENVSECEDLERVLIEIFPDFYRQITSLELHSKIFEQAVSKILQSPEKQILADVFVERYEKFETQFTVFLNCKIYHDALHGLESHLLISQAFDAHDTELEWGDLLVDFEWSVHAAFVESSKAIEIIKRNDPDIANPLVPGSLFLSESLLAFTQKSKVAPLLSPEGFVNRVATHISQGMPLANIAMVKAGTKLLNSEVYEELKKLLKENEKDISYDWLVSNFKSVLQKGIQQHDAWQKIRGHANSVSMWLQMIEQQSDLAPSNPAATLHAISSTWSSVSNGLQVNREASVAFGYSESESEKSVYQLAADVDEVISQQNLDGFEEKFHVFTNASKQYFHKLDVTLKNDSSGLKELMSGFLIQLKDMRG